MSQLDRLDVLSSKDPVEIIIVTFDFVNRTPVIDSVVSVSVTVFKGVDANPASMILNAPVISGTNVLQLFQGGLDDVFYKVRADIQIGSQRYALTAILPVKSQ